MKLRLSPFFLLAIVVISTFVNLPKLPLDTPINNFLDRYPLKLGLDLQGGTQLILETQMDKISDVDKDSALESSREVIEKRVNLFGVSESLVQTSKVGNKNRILVELPGLKDASAAADLVGKTAQLDFREVPPGHRFDASESALIAAVSAKPSGLTGADLKKAQVIFGGAGVQSGPEVGIEFTTEGAKKFAEITKRNIGKPLYIFLDDRLVSSPNVEQEIIGKDAIIRGQFSADEAKNLTLQLNAGALPVPIKIMEQRQIGPSLGEESINKSLIAGSIGLLTVILYMAFYYGRLGLIANIALIIYTLITLAIFKTGLFIIPPITLTLSGIAAFILSIGMAVDANILIFERMKEELRWGRESGVALELGFKRAWSSIWASNVASLITASILYYMGTSVVKGFAITLSIGVLVSMFTAIFVSRTLLRLIMR